MTIVDIVVIGAELEQKYVSSTTGGQTPVTQATTVGLLEPYTVVGSSYTSSTQVMTGGYRRSAVVVRQEEGGHILEPLRLSDETVRDKTAVRLRKSRREKDWHQRSGSRRPR